MSYKNLRISERLFIDLIPIFKSSFSMSPNIESIRKKFDTQYLGTKNVGFLAYSASDEPAGFYGVYPVKLRIGNSIILGCQSGDTMVHKNHQGKGLFINLALKTYELCKELGIKGVFGFPSDTSYAGFTKKLNWKHNDNILKYEIIIPTLPISEFFYRLPKLRRVFQGWFNIILFFLPKGNYFKGSIAEFGQDGVDRDLGFWNYKINNQNIKCIKLYNRNLVLKWEGKLSIGDFEFKDDIEFNRSIFALKILCFFSGINRLTFYVSPGSKMDLFLKNNNINSTTGLAIGFLEFDDKIDMSNLKFTYFDFDTF